MSHRWLELTAQLKSPRSTTWLLTHYSELPAIFAEVWVSPFFSLPVSSPCSPTSQIDAAIKQGEHFQEVAVAIGVLLQTPAIMANRTLCERVVTSALQLGAHTNSRDTSDPFVAEMLTYVLRTPSTLPPEVDIPVLHLDELDLLSAIGVRPAIGSSETALDDAAAKLSNLLAALKRTPSLPYEDLQHLISELELCYVALQHEPTGTVVKLALDECRQYQVPARLGSAAQQEELIFRDQCIAFILDALNGSSNEYGQALDLCAVGATLPKRAILDGILHYCGDHLTAIEAADIIMATTKPS
jgi:hypothetical protein